MIIKNKKAQQLDETITWFVAFGLIFFVSILFVGFTVSNAPKLLINKNEIKTSSLQTEKDFNFNTEKAILFIEFFNTHEKDLSIWVDDGHTLTNPEVYQIMHNVDTNEEVKIAYNNYNAACNSIKEFLQQNAELNSEICLQTKDNENIFAIKESDSITCGIEAIACPRQKYIHRSFPLISQNGNKIEVFYNE